MEFNDNPLTPHPMSTTTAQPRPYWFSKTHKKALAAMTDDWQSLGDLLGRGFGTLCLAELEHLGLVERKLEPLPTRNALPTDFFFYRKAQAL